MIGPEDKDALAAEYVLGTLEADERATVERQRVTDRQLDAAVRAWEQRLSPLAVATPPAEPPADLFARIERRIVGAPPPAVVQLQTRVRRWQLASAGLGALAAGLAALLLVPGLVRAPSPSNYVAVLQQGAASPAFVVSVDLAAGTVTARPVSAGAQSGKSYELWLVDDSLGDPRSLGIVADAGFTVRPALARFERAVAARATYAISLEPAGGSPTGKPTGPVLFTGKLIQATP
jgi:anti-sigma-K factor RskA